MFDIQRVPFSRFGSYFSISRGNGLAQGDGLYVSVLSAQAPRAFKVDAVRDGATLPFEVETSASSLRLKPEGGGLIEIVIDDCDAVRVRGSGVSLRLEMHPDRWHHTYQMPDGAWGFNMNPHNTNLALDPLKGTIDMDAPWEQGKGFCYESSRMIATVVPDKTHSFEVAIDEFRTTWVRPDRVGFDDCRRAVEDACAAWAENLPDVAPGYEQTRDLAAYVNWSATVRPAGFVTRPTMLMSKMGMCNVFHWDHAFNAMAHCRHQPDLAWDQLVVMQDLKDEFGKPPSNYNRDRIGWTISNPPVQGWALKRMWDRNPSMMTPERLSEAYDYLSGWTDWICNYRTWPGESLPHYLHGFDSGWDNSTIFDQGVPVVSPDQPAYLILQMEVLADLATSLGRESEAATWRDQGAAMLAGLIDELWEGDRFVGKLRPSGDVVQCESLIICMPMVLGKRLPEAIRARLVSRIESHLTPHGLATEKLDSPKFTKRGYWRGSIWAPVTLLIVCGLVEVGETDLARQIVRGFCDMCRDQGFYENFSPQTGEGHFDPSYTWTSSVFLIFQSEFPELCSTSPEKQAIAPGRTT